MEAYSLFVFLKKKNFTINILAFFSFFLFKDKSKEVDAFTSLVLTEN